MPPILKAEDFIGQLTPEITQEIMLAMAEQAPLTSYLIENGYVRETRNPRIDWYNRSIDSIRTMVNNGGAAYDGNTVSIVVDNAATFEPNDMIYCEATGEVMMCASVNTGTNTIIVARGVGSTTGSAPSVANDAWLRNIGKAAGEGGDAPTPNMGAATNAYNFVQHFKETVALTGLAARSSTETEEERASQVRLAIEKLMRDIEQSVLFGRRSNDLTDVATKRVYSMDGLYSAIATNVVNGAGAVDIDDANTFFEAAFSSTQSPRLLMVAGSTVARALHDLYAYEQSGGADVPVGLRISTIITPFGDVDLLRSWAFRGGFDGTAMTFAPGKVLLRPMPGMMPHVVRDIQQRRTDAVEDLVQAQVSVEYGDEKEMARWYGVTGSA